MKKINHSSVIWLIFALIIISSLVTLGLMVGLSGGFFIFDTNMSVLAFSSLFLLLICIIFSFKSDSNLSILLPFVLLAFPSIVNNCFPGVYLESSQAKVIFPYVTHIEIFCIVILCFKFWKNGSLKIDKFTPLFYVGIFLFLLSTIVNIQYYDTEVALLLLAGLFPVRILILLHILFSNSSIKFEYIIYGYMLSIIFLFIESSLFTILQGEGVWASGSLGINTYGNIVGQIVALLIAYNLIAKVKNFNSCLVWIIVFLGMLIVVLTNTRMAVLAFFLIMILYVFPRLSVLKRLGLLVMGILVVVVVLSKLVNEEKFDFANVFEKISINKTGSSLTDIVEIDKSESTNSLITRLNLYQTSYNMLIDNPICGVGFPMFNRLKYRYGFSEDVIIDSHNGYLFLLSQLGFIGLLWIWILYLRPIVLYVRYRSKISSMQFVCMINIGMSFCDLTNAGIFKTAVLSILLMNIVFMNKLIVEYNNRYSTQ